MVTWHRLSWLCYFYGSGVLCRSHIMFRLNQVCEIHTKFKSQVIKGMSIGCVLFGILPLGGDF